MGKDDHDHRARNTLRVTGSGEQFTDVVSVEEAVSDQDSLAKMITPDDATTTVAETLDSMSSSVSRPLIKKPNDFKGKRLGSYEIQRLIGKGGIGLVYLAFDHQLTRRVALKLLRTDDPEAAHRLLDEARAQARVEHENVCQVYEAGEVDGQTYIAMQYIEGKPLTRAFQEMTLEEKVRVIQRVAEGLETAHAQNLIHRDVKPGNILVERTPRAEWKPYILDFGLAREQAAPGETTTGEVKGTPSYMPPEQVTGQIHTLDARADIYSLGATFYEGISGRQLFPETSGGLAVMLKVLNEDPEPIRVINKAVPIDIESIIMRCLEKDPNRRYGSAREFGEDLQRFLDGEPILARPISLPLRLWRRLKKRRVAALSVGLVATVLASITVLMASQLRTRAKTRWMNEYRQEVHRINSRISNAYAEALHDITAEKGDIRKRLMDIEEGLEDQSSLARGPANYALGSGYLALHEYEKARQHLEIAWRKGTRDAEVGYALGRTLGSLYKKELQIARRIEDQVQRQERLSEIEEIYRKPALDYLRKSPNVEADSIELVEALVAFWEGRHEEALKKTAASQRRAPWLYEALTVQADVHTAIGLAHNARGDYDAALAAYRRAQEVYGKAAEKGRSDARIYEGQASLAWVMMDNEVYGLGSDFQPAFEYGLEASLKSRRIDPSRVESHHLESMLYWRIGSYKTDIGTDPTEDLNHATEAAIKALEIAPDHVDTHACLGWSQSVLALWQIGQDIDPRHATEKALHAFSSGIQIDPQIAQSHHGLGFVHANLAQWQTLHGRDASESLSHAIDALERAVVLEPSHKYAMEHLGDAYLARINWELLHDENPSSSLQEADRAYSRLEQLNPNYLWAHNGVGNIWVLRAEQRLNQGQDPTNDLAQAQIAFEKGRENDPDQGWLFFGFGRVALLEGRWRILQGGDPTKSFIRARKNLEQGQESVPDEPWGFQLQANLHLDWAKWKIASGESPKSEIDFGLRTTAQGLEIPPRTAEIQALQGLFHLLSAQANPQRRRQHQTDARVALEGALELNSNLGKRYGAALEQARE